MLPPITIYDAPPYISALLAMADKPFILSSSHLAPSGTFEPPFLIWPTSDGPLRFLGLVARSRSPSPEPSPRRLEAYTNLFGESPARFVETQQALLAPETASDSIFTLHEEDGAQVPADEAASGSMAMVGSSQIAVDDEPNHDVQGEAMQYYEEASAIAPLLQPMMQGYPEHASATPYPADASAESPGPSYTMHYIGIAQGALGILSRKQPLQTSSGVLGNGHPSSSRPPLEPNPFDSAPGGPLGQLVEDALGCAKVVGGAFYAKPLRSLGARRSGNRGVATPPVQPATPTSTALPAVFRARTPGAGGFPGRKVAYRNRMSREGLPTALATTPNEFNAPFLTPNNLDSPHLPLPGGTRPLSAGGMRALSPSRPGPSNTSLPSLPELTLVLPASTLQGSTPQGSTQQGSTQQGSTQQGSTQQGYNQQGPVQGHSGATLGRSTSGSSSSWQPGRHSMGPSSPSGSKQRPTPVLLTEMFNFPGDSLSPTSPYASTPASPYTPVPAHSPSTSLHAVSATSADHATSTALSPHAAMTSPRHSITNVQPSLSVVTVAPLSPGSSFFLPATAAFPSASTAFAGFSAASRRSGSLVGRTCRVSMSNGGAHGGGHHGDRGGHDIGGNDRNSGHTIASPTRALARPEAWVSMSVTQTPLARTNSVPVR